MNSSNDLEGADNEDQKKSYSNGSGWSVLSRAIDVLGPSVPANGAGIVIIVFVAGVVLTVVGARYERTIVVIIASLIVVLAVLYALVILIPQWWTQGRDVQDSAPVTRTPNDPVIAGTVLQTPRDTRILADLLTDEQHDAVCAVVSGAIKDAAKVIGIDVNLVRGNIFGLDSTGFLRIMPQFDHNMKFVKERTTRMPINEGSTGHAWHRCRTNIAIRPREQAAVDSLPPHQTARLEPTLQWIISIPVFVKDGEKEPTWILNIDGLEESKSVEELEPAVGALLRWAEQLSRILLNVCK